MHAQNLKNRAVIARGFSLVELLVAIAILAILVGLAAPSFAEFVLTNRLNDTANRLVTSAAAARSEAIKRNVLITLCMSANQSTCTTSGEWQQGWIIRSPTEVLQIVPSLNNGLKINASVNSIDFDPTGVGTTAATLTVCRPSPNVGTQERVVAVTATGKARSTRTTLGVCA